MENIIKCSDCEEMLIESVYYNDNNQYLKRTKECLYCNFIMACDNKEE